MPIATETLPPSGKTAAANGVSSANTTATNVDAKGAFRGPLFFGWTRNPPCGKCLDVNSQVAEPIPKSPALAYLSQDRPSVSGPKLRGKHEFRNQDPARRQERPYQN